MAAKKNTIELETEKHSTPPSPIRFHRPTISRDELENVLDCLIAEQLGQGPLTNKFTRQFAKTLGLPHCIAVSSLTSAYHLIFRALSLGDQDTLFLHPFSSAAAWYASRYVKMPVILIDLLKNSFQMDLHALQASIAQLRAKKTQNSKIVVIIDQPFGAMMSDQQVFLQLLAEDVTLIEDVSSFFIDWDIKTKGSNNSTATQNAHHLNQIKNKRATQQNLNGVAQVTKSKNINQHRRNRFSTGLSSDRFSFIDQARWKVCNFDQECVITTGNGGMLSCPPEDQEIFSRICQMNLGFRHKKNGVNPLARKSLASYVEPEEIYDYRFNDFQAAIGLQQLKKVHIMLPRRRRIAHRYLQELVDSNYKTYFQFPQKDSYLRFPIVSRRDYKENQLIFRKQGIETARISENPLHHKLGFKNHKFPNAERLYRKATCIPIYPVLSQRQVERIVHLFRSVALFPVFLLLSVVVNSLSLQANNKKDSSSDIIQILSAKNQLTQQWKISDSKKIFESQQSNKKKPNPGKESQLNNKDASSIISDFVDPPSSQVKIIFCNDRSVAGTLLNNIPQVILLQNKIGQVSYEKQVKREDIREIQFIRWQGEKYRKSAKGIIYRFYPIAYRISLKDGQLLQQGESLYPFWEKFQITNKHGTTTLYTYWLDLLQSDGTWHSKVDYNKKNSSACHRDVIKKIVFTE